MVFSAKIEEFEDLPEFPLNLHTVVYNPDLQQKVDYAGNEYFVPFRNNSMTNDKIIFQVARKNQ